MDGKFKYCEEVSERLKKYDPLNYIRIDKGKLSIAPQNLSSSVSPKYILDRLKEMYTNPQKECLNKLALLSGFDNQILPQSENISSRIRKHYAEFESDCMLFLDEGYSWDIYKKDILRGIAFHEWIESLEESEIDVDDGHYPHGGSDEFNNLPIKIELKEKSVDNSAIGNSYHTIYLKTLGGGLLSRCTLFNQRISNIFRCSDNEYDNMGQIFNGQDIVKDKNGINRQELLRQLSMEFKHNYGVYTAQKHYQRIVPRIIVEKLLIENNAPSQPITDYKFYCFHGEPKYIQRISGRDFKTHIAKKSFFDMNWKWIPLLEEESTLGIHKPFMLEKMIAISKILSKPFPFVRVDLYLIENKIIFGEMTFTPGQSETGYYYKLNSGRLGDLIHL